MNNIKKLNILSILLLILILSGCGSNLVNIKIPEPAEINIKSIKKIAVLEFAVPANADKNIGSATAHNLNSHLLKNNYFEIIGHKELSKIANEQNFGTSEAFDSLKMQHLGQALGVDALIFGTINIYTHSDASAHDAMFRVYRAERTANVGITFKIMDINKNEIISSKTYNKSMRSTTQRSYTKETKDEKIINIVAGVITNNDAISPADKAKNEALASLTAPKKMMDALIDEISSSFVKQITPCYYTEERLVESGNDKKMKIAVDCVKRGLWNDAKNLWEDVLENQKAFNDHPAAHYNLGLYYETLGDLIKAEQEYNSAFEIEKKEEYSEAISNILRRKK